MAGQSEPRPLGGTGRWRAALAIVALAALAAGWALLRGPAGTGPVPAPEARALPASGTAAKSAGGAIELVRGVETRVDPGSLVAGEPLAIRIALPADAADIGIESIWIYGENHAPSRISGQRLRPSEVRIELGPEVLTPGRHIVELRTDEITAIPLRRYSFEIR